MSEKQILFFLNGLEKGDNFQLYPLKTECTLPHHILEVSIFDFRYVRLYDVDNPKEKRLIYLQTV